MEAHGLRVFDVEELKSHGGSLRVFACRAEQPRLMQLRRAYKRSSTMKLTAKLDRLEGYERFARQVKETKLEFVDFLLTAAKQGKKVCGYGAPGKERHTPALLRHWKRSDRVHGGSQPIQARALSAGKPYTDLSS